ncbi:hypothetical protein EIP91_003582 [Steccherinum ochraceum]|uniref:PWWP domain-containing protein n=1 Tax=Steccherinum ochraceum TaxID=92696 RepID=A0A4R0RQZ2_9APHY|nr:hypothetical protein EIP91_003582 [Steccherinum ochraceum]
MSKKGAKSQPAPQTYELRDVVLAKVRGFPAWPGMIVDPESVPKDVIKERPGAKSKGSWYCVRFFPAGDYAWLMSKDISKLQAHEIQAYIDEPYKKSTDLLKGYRIAQDPTKWEEERELARAQAEENEANAEVDQLEESDAEPEAEDDDDEPKKPKTKKRKRDSEAASVGAKKAPKSKSSKKGSSEPPATEKKKRGAGGKKGVKSKAMVESEDEGGAEAEAEADEDAGPSKKASPPPAKKAKRDKDGDEDADPALANDLEAQKVRDWRHKLQKAFLNTKVVPKDEDMPQYDELFTTVEKYDGMTIAYLTFSKIGKVMRHIHALSASKIPRNDEFHFRERAKVLVDKWGVLINGPGGKASSEKPNGAATNGKSESSPKEEESAAMDQDAKGEDAKSGSADAMAEDDAPAGAEESMLADVTMSEAA